jgi:hypothetical protein
MGILDGLFGKRPRVDRAAFQTVVPRLVSELELVRKQFVFGSVTALESEGAPIAGISPMLDKGSELDAALKGFQLTDIMGFAWNYMEFEDQLPFDRQLTAAVESNDRDMTSRYRDRYLDCQGEIDLLSTFLAEDIHRIWGCPEPSAKFKAALGKAAITLGIVSQVATANVFGDTKTERKLKNRLRV